MRKIIAGTVALLMAAACSNLSQYTTVSSSATPKEKMRACMISEANSKLRAGTLFNAGISATADELVNICIKKLALQAAGISEESQSEFGFGKQLNIAFAKTGEVCGRRAFCFG